MVRWILRKAHSRRLISGNVVAVRAAWTCYETDPEAKRRRYRHLCPKCETEILSVHMPNGGWVHYYAAKGLRRIKHPCLHQGEGLSRSRDERTLDLFR